MLTYDEILTWLREENQRQLSKLWSKADAVRRASVGDDVHLRGLVEISNYCSQECWYCGIRAPNTSIQRYRMTVDEILTCARQAVAHGYGTVVLQSGEDHGFGQACVSELIRCLKRETPLAVTLSLGERTEDDLRAWKEAGADRYLLRFETSNRALYARIHPARANRSSDRISLLHTLRTLGYETGSGIMIGLPGQTYTDLANDILLFAKLELDMIGVGPFILHPDTPLFTVGHGTEPIPNQVPATDVMTYKVIALSRMMCPEANIPATTALATVGGETGRTLGLSRGANVVMPNLTPAAYREQYSIYPNKACLIETAEASQSSLRKQVRALGRTLGVGPGTSKSFARRS